MDRDLKEILSWLEVRRDRPTWEEISPRSKELKFWWARYEQLVVKGETLYIRWEAARPTEQSRLRLVIPPGLRPAFMQLFHDEKTAGYLGVTKTFSKMCRSSFY